LFRKSSKLFLIIKIKRKKKWFSINRNSHLIFYKIPRIFESDDSADEYNEDNKDLEDFKDKDDEDEFSDSDKIPLNDLLKEDNENGDLQDDNDDDYNDENGIMEWVKHFVIINTFTIFTN